MSSRIGSIRQLSEAQARWQAEFLKAASLPCHHRRRESSSYLLPAAASCLDPSWSSAESLSYPQVGSPPPDRFVRNPRSAASQHTKLVELAFKYLLQKATRMLR